MPMLPPHRPFTNKPVKVQPRFRLSSSKPVPKITEKIARTLAKAVPEGRRPVELKVLRAPQ